jgi:phage terminase large subunit
MPLHNRTQRYAAIVAHRRAGKTVSTINDMIKRAVQCPYEHGRYAYVAPYLGQAKEVSWEYLKRFAGPIIADKNEGELWVELINGARIRAHGADNPDRLRGSYLDGVVLDEYADMRPSVWGEVIRPMLADRSGWATFIGTPKGRNEFHAVWSRAQVDPAWLGMMLRASESGIISNAELEDAKYDMTPEQYAQEFECSFEAAILGAYYGKEISALERAGRIRAVPYAADLPVQTAWDLGMSDSTAIWFFQVAPGEIRVIDFYENHGQPLRHYVAEIEARGYPRGTDWLPHDARVRSLETGRTRVETLIALGRKPKIASQQNLMDGINSARLVLPLCYFDAGKCRDGLEALRQYRADYDEKTKTFRDMPRHDWSSHAADAWRYLSLAYREMLPPPAKAKPLPAGSITFAEMMAREEAFAAQQRHMR